MLRTRIIPVLLLRSGGGLVKTEKFASPKYVGDPTNAVRIFNDKEVDELMILDIAASSEGRSPSFDLVERIAGEAFMPVCYGGGVRSVADARRLLKLGVEKVALNSAALARPGLVAEIAAAFGAQCVVGVVDVKKTFWGKYQVHSHARASVPEPDPVRWAQRLVREGAGEILVQAVDRDGTMKGFDLDLLKAFDVGLPVPLIAAGGARDVQSMRAALQACRLSALGVGARFVYHGPHRGVLVNYLSPAELESLQTVTR